MWARTIAISLFVAMLGLTQQPSAPECRGVRDAHPCHCMEHVNQVQNEFMAACEKDKLLAGDKGSPGEIAAACAAGISTHCTIVEHYGNWGTDEDGNHTNPMPEQCTRACTRSHCRCDADGPLCHFAHEPEDDKGGKK